MNPNERTLSERLSDTFVFLRTVDHMRTIADDPTVARSAESAIMARELADLERVSYQTEVETQ